MTWKSPSVGQVSLLTQQVKKIDLKNINFHKFWPTWTILIRNCWPTWALSIGWAEEHVKYKYILNYLTNTNLMAEWSALPAGKCGDPGSIPSASIFQKYQMYFELTCMRFCDFAILIGNGWRSLHVDGIHRRGEYHWTDVATGIGRRWATLVQWGRQGSTSSRSTFRGAPVTSDLLCLNSLNWINCCSFDLIQMSTAA